MNEEDIVLQGVELDTSVDVGLPIEEVALSETVEYVGVNEQEELTIDVTEVAGVVSGHGESSNHTHNIDQIKNLDNALNTLGAPHEVYSKNGGYAEFRQWADSNTQSENRIGYFVSLVNKDGNNYIDICTDKTADVYGVTVNHSGFCGYQYSAYNIFDDLSINKANSNEPYEKVCLLGNVMARVYSKANFDSIHIGDFVIPDQYGCAIKSENNIGFKVIMKEAAGVGESSWNKVAIALVPQNDNVARVMNELEKTNNGMSEIKVQLVNLNDKVDSNISISGKFEDLEEAFGKLESNVDKKLEIADKTLKEAINISSSATEAMGTMATKHNEAMDSVKMAIGNTNAVLDKVDAYELETLAQYKDKVVGFFSEANEDEVTVGTIAKELGELSMVKQSADALHRLVCHIDTYSVGSKSPTYGLSCDEAKNICQEYEYIYVPTVNHTEESYIYLCASALEDAKYYFTIDNSKYLFVPPKRYSMANLVFNSKLNVLTIDGVTVEVDQVKNVDGVISLDFESELTITFTTTKSYKWTYNKQDGVYKYWCEDLPVSFKADGPPSEGYELWYTRNGVTQGESSSEYLYSPNTLYHKVASGWVAVATANYKDARTISLIEQTADSLSSTITNVAGDVSTITQRVDRIETLVKEDGNLSTINQTADNIRLGVYEAGGGSSELELLLSGLRSDAMKTGHAWVCKVLDVEAVAIDGKYYSQPPVWNGSEFSFEGIEPSVGGTYCFTTESKQKYYHNVDGGYDVYTCGNTAMASLNTRVTETESEVESWALFRSEANETSASVTQRANEKGAEIASVVYGEYNKQKEVIVDVDSANIDVDSLDRYTMPPKWSTIVIDNGDEKSEYDGFIFDNKYLCPL